jgi:ABC-type antimicrobial peptide transport system permease subunit
MFIFRFDTYLFPKVAQVIFIILAVLIILGTIISAGGSLFAPYVGLMTRLGGFVGSLLAGALGLLFLRFFFEFSLVIFSIYERLKDIADNRKL